MAGHHDFFLKYKRNFMKKITANLGPSFNEFDHQIKSILNDIAEQIEHIRIFQQKILTSSFCHDCKAKADILTHDLNNGSFKNYCNKCLKQ